MILNFVLWGLALASSSVVPASAHAQQAPNELDRLSQHRARLFNKVAPSVAFVRAGAGYGSGFFLNTKGLILTNAHVVGEEKEVQVVLHHGQRLSGKVVALAPEKVDLALVQVSYASQPVALRSVQTLQIGEWAGSVNHGQGGIWTFNEGMISNFYPLQSKTPVIQTQLPLNPGSSGGPLFDSKGQAFGVITAGITGANSINFALRLDLVFSSFPDILPQLPVVVLEAPEGAPVFLADVQVGVGPKVVLPVSPGKHIAFTVSGGKRVVKSFDFPSQKHLVLRP